MTANDAITKIRVLLGVEEEVAVAMNSGVLTDGTQVEVEGEFEVGKTLFVVTADGSIPAPAGMHQTDDNKLITVDEAGIITSIEEVAADVAPEATVDVALAEEVIVEETPDKDKEIEVMLADDLVEKIVEELKPLLETISDLQAKVTEMEAKFQKFSKEPAAKPIKKAEAFAANKLSAVERIALIRKTK
tara:strand:+ start:179 stop:745 length:567 start_codon:yes stop_codon:yes gene_type:complete